MRSPKSPARRALPPIWLIVNGDSTYVYAFLTRYEAVEFARWRPRGWEWRIVKYLPAPVPPRSRKGGSRG